MREISEGDKANFETLRVAGGNGDLCLLDCYDSLSDSFVSTVCAVNIIENKVHHVTPLAVMVDQNVYIDLHSPDSDLYKKKEREREDEAKKNSPI